MDPATGFVRAMVGGRDFDESHFNRAVQAKRQPGSAFKPFVYAAALEAGYTPATVIQNLNAPIATLQGAWTPEDEHSSADSMNLRTALRTSSNRAAVRLLQQVGIPKTVQYAKTMGVGNLPSVPSLALGSGEVTLQSMTAAYAGFDNHGDVPHPLLIRRVEDLSGHLLFESEPETTHAISPQTAFLMTTMMADVINAGTGARARALGFTLPAAGKTGTTNDFNDAWFIGFTPSLVAGVWVGFDQPHTILPNGFAADVAVPVWANFMKQATKADKPVGFSPPPGIVTATVCRLSGKLAAEGCNHAVALDDHGEMSDRSMVYTEYFARGTEPSALCDLHPMGGLSRRRRDRVRDLGQAGARAHRAAGPPAGGRQQRLERAATAAGGERTSQEEEGFLVAYFRRRQGPREQRQQSPTAVIRCVSLGRYAVSRCHRSSEACRAAVAFHRARLDSSQSDLRRAGWRRANASWRWRLPRRLTASILGAVTPGHRTRLNTTRVACAPPAHASSAGSIPTWWCSSPAIPE